MKNRPSYKINYNGILKCLPYSRFQKSAANKYLLLAEFSVHTVNYGPSFFPLIYGRARAINRWKKPRIHNLQYGPKKRG